MTAPLPKTLSMVRMRVAANLDDPPTQSTDTLNHTEKIVIVLDCCDKHNMSSFLLLSSLYLEEHIFF